MICTQCNKEFIPSKYTPNQKCCSEGCRKARHKEGNAKYQRTDEAKAWRRKYIKTDKAKKTRKKYEQSDRGKKIIKKGYHKYNKTEKRKEERRIFAKSDSAKKSHKKHYELNYSKISKRQTIYKRERQKINPIYKLAGYVRTRLSIFLKTRNINKTNKTFKMVGCTPEFLKSYLEKKFKPGMTWKNHSLKGWHVDHKIPLEKAKTPEAVEKLMHYSNLQPLWATENLKKGDKY